MNAIADNTLTVQNAVKAELKAELKSLGTKEKYLAARQFALREMVEAAQGLRIDEKLTENKGRRILAREVFEAMCSIPTAEFPPVERPDFSQKMTRTELIDASIVVMRTRVANEESRIERMEKVERLTTKIAHRSLENVFDESGRELAFKVLEAWESDPFTEFTRPGVPQNF